MKELLKLKRATSREKSFFVFFLEKKEQRNVGSVLFSGSLFLRNRIKPEWHCQLQRRLSVYYGTTKFLILCIQVQAHKVQGKHTVAEVLQPGV